MTTAETRARPALVLVRIRRRTTRPHSSILMPQPPGRSIRREASRLRKMRLLEEVAELVDEALRLG